MNIISRAARTIESLAKESRDAIMKAEATKEAVMPSYMRQAEDQFYGRLASDWQFLAQIAWEDGRYSEANLRELKAAECLHQAMHHRPWQPEF